MNAAADTVLCVAPPRNTQKTGNTYKQPRFVFPLCGFSLSLFCNYDAVHALARSSTVSRHSGIWRSKVPISMEKIEFSRHIPGTTNTHAEVLGMYRAWEFGLVSLGLHCFLRLSSGVSCLLCSSVVPVPGRQKTHAEVCGFVVMAFGLLSLGPHCVLQLYSAALIVVSVPGCCCAYSFFSVQHKQTATAANKPQCYLAESLAKPNQTMAFPMW